MSKVINITISGTAFNGRIYIDRNELSNALAAVIGVDKLNYEAFLVDIKNHIDSINVPDV